MYENYDAQKGKVFTSIVTKHPVETLIQTTDQLIRGFIHLRPQERLLDSLNPELLFLAVTSAKVFDKMGTMIYKTNFLALNQNHILWIIPINDLESNGANNE